MPWTKVATAYPHAVARCLGYNLADAAGVRLRGIDPVAVVAAARGAAQRRDAALARAAAEWAGRQAGLA